MYRLTVNGEQHNVDVDADTPLLWVMRDTLKMTGTKFGCGLAQCGACTMLIDGQATRTCTFPISGLSATSEITTIEGIAEPATQAGNSAAVQQWHPVQQAFQEEQVPQCGYCQSGQILSAVALLQNNAQPNDDEINDAMQNICRCGTYPRIRKAVHRAAAIMKEQQS